MMFMNLEYLIWVAPALLLAAWAQMKVHAAYGAAKQEPAPLSGAAAARHILNTAGLSYIDIEETPGYLSDHYDPAAKVLRLSPENFRGRSLAAVGIAAHEAGHAIQDAQQYGFMVVRNAAVPVANFGGGISMLLAPHPKQQRSPDQSPSYLITGPTNTATQGVPVPLVFGQVRVGTIMAGSSLVTEEYHPGAVSTGALSKAGLLHLLVSSGS